ncbi:MAG: polysaccharide biosynthesis C-terminal domain-containing protein [Bacteroidota bacterium]|nr:polysaccharide biosynthesis C-terminal domain-containing protein [Bacteroidota bacterium]
MALNPLKKLAGQTAIYGLSTIIGRFLNYLLTFFWSYVFLHPAEFAVVPYFFAIVPFVSNVLTYGMETAFFRFSLKKSGSNAVYSTSLISLLISTSFFLIFILSFTKTIAFHAGYPDHPEYIVWLVLILCLDTLTAIPFAKLRIENKAVRFALLKTINIAINIFFNLFFLLFLPWISKQAETPILQSIISFIYHPSIGVGYIFIANLIASIITILLLVPEYFKIKYVFDFPLWKELFKYAWPLMILGLAGSVNETFDRAIMAWILPKSANPAFQLGVYGVCYKFSIIMTLFITMFRYAAEPFFFSHASETDSRTIYSTVMNWFIIVCSFIFLTVMLNVNILKLFISREYRVGLIIVPILLIANMFLGIFYNLSIWYKLTDKTKLGALVSIIGAVITIILNFILVPIFGYIGAAWATLICYLSVMVIAYFMGQKYYPINYNLKKFGLYLSAALILYALNFIIRNYHLPLQFVLNNLFLLPLIWLVIKVEKIDVRAILIKLNGNIKRKDNQSI